MTSGRYGMSAGATAAYDALREVDRPVTRAIAGLLGAAQGTAPADRWQHCAEDIVRARALLDEAAARLSVARAEAESEPCVHFTQPGHGPAQKPDPTVYGGDPDDWPMCRRCAAIAHVNGYGTD